MRNIYMVVVILVAIMQLTVFQGYTQPSDRCDDHRLRGKGYVKIVDYPGAQEIFNTWQEGKIVLTNEKEINSLLLNLNGYTGELVYYNKVKNKAVSVDHEMVSAIHIINSGKTHYFEKHYYENLFQKGTLFFESLYKGNVSFLKLHEVQLQNANALGKTENREYVKNEKYFFLNANEELYHTRIGRRHLIRVIPKAKKSKAREIIRQHNLKIKTGDQMAKAIEIFEERNIPFDFINKND